MQMSPTFAKQNASSYASAEVRSIGSFAHSQIKSRSNQEFFCDCVYTLLLSVIPAGASINIHPNNDFLPARISNYTSVAVRATEFLLIYFSVRYD